MEYINFGRTGVQVSRLALGCMNFGGRTNAAESEEILLAAFEAGINFIDTANVYGHEPANFEVGRGRSEEIIGRIIEQVDNRSDLFLATKAHYPMGQGPNVSGNSRRHIIEQCHASLRRLRTEYIDLYQLHASDSNVPIDETLRALDDLIRAGKVRYIGTSGFPAWKQVEALWMAKELGLNRFVSEQPPYNLLDRRIERELLPMAASYGFAVLPWAPLAGGFLTGKYKRDQPVPADSRFSRFWGGFKEEHYQTAVFDVVELVEEVAQRHEVSMAQIGLAWQLARPGITSPIIGPRTLAQLEDNLGALYVKLQEDELARLDAIVPSGRFVVSYYGGLGSEMWKGWQPCLFN